MGRNTSEEKGRNCFEHVYKNSRVMRSKLAYSSLNERGDKLIDPPCSTFPIWRRVFLSVILQVHSRLKRVLESQMWPIAILDISRTRAVEWATSSRNSNTFRKPLLYLHIVDTVQSLLRFLFLSINFIVRWHQCKILICVCKDHESETW